MQREWKLRALRRTLGECREKGEEAIFWCPKHPAREGRSQGQLSVNLRTDWFNCWSCGFKSRRAGLIPLLRLGGKSQDLLEYVNERGGLVAEPAQERAYDTPVLPEGFRTLSETHRSPYYRQAIDYLDSRGVTADDILMWRLGYCEDGEFRHRIVFPSFDQHGDLNFVSGRTYRDGQLKYRHGNYSKDIVWNDCMVDWSRPIVVTEGPFDAIVAGENSVPIQGTSLNDRSLLFSKIVSVGCDPYFALDADAFLRQLSIMRKLIEHGVAPRHVPLGGRKDVGEMGRDEFAARKAEAIPIREELDILRLRLTA